MDEGCNIAEGEQNSAGLSGTIAELLAGHYEFFPPWLLLLCSARKQSKAVTKMFTGEYKPYELLFTMHRNKHPSFLQESYW